MADTTDPRRPISDASALERDLRDLAHALDYPAATTIAPKVRARLNAVPEQRAPFWLGWVGTPRRTLVSLAVAFVLLFALVLAVSPGTRTTVADRLGVPGIDISNDAAPMTATGTDLALGRDVTLQYATNRAGFATVSPPLALGDPDAVFLNEQTGGTQIAYIYAPRADLPEVADTGVGLLVLQFIGETNESFIQKQLRADSTIELVSVDGKPGYWISGEPHVFFYQDFSGAIREETIRLAGNVLLWEDAGRTLRIESALNRDAAIRIAESMTR